MKIYEISNFERFFGAFYRKYKIDIVIFAFAVVVHLAFFLFYLNARNGDFIATIRGADGYFEISENLINGNGYSDDQGPPYTPNSIRPPAWILLMALIAWVFGSYVPVFALQLIMASFVPVLGMHLASRIISRPYLPIIGVLLALEPAALFSSTMVVSETSFSFFFLVFLFFLFRYFDKETTRDIVCSGLFLGLAILVKPTVQFFPILIPAALLFIYKNKLSSTLFKHLVYFILVSMLIIIPWIYRNYKTFGVFGLTSQPAYNLYTVLVPTVLSLDKGTNYESEHHAVQQLVDSRGGGVTLENSDYYTKEALSILIQHKTAFLKSIGISVVTFFTHDHMLTVLGYGGATIPNFLDKPALILLFTNPVLLAKHIVAYGSSPGIFVLLGRLFWIVTTILFFAGAWFYLRREKFSPFAYTALLMVAYFVLMTAANGFGMNGRFRIPVNVFIFTFALYGASVAWRSTIKKLFSQHEKTFNHHTDL